MKENEILREIMRDAKIGWWQADRNRRVFHISEGLRDLLGVASCDVTYEEFGKMITPAYREYALASIGVRGGAERLYPLQGPEGEVAITPRGNFEVNNSDAIHTALLAGLGIGNMPDFIVERDLATGRLVPLLPDHALPEHGIWCLYPKRRHLPAKVEAWLGFLHERLGLR